MKSFNFEVFKRQFSIIVVLFISFAFTSCKEDEDGVSNRNIVQVASSNAEFSTLVAAIQKAGLQTTLEGAGPFTVFAPTNAAFTAAGITDLDDFTADQLRPILLYHVLSGEKMSAQLTSGPQTTQSNNANLYLTAGSSGVSVNGNATVTQADIDASNGVIHKIDKVLMPPTGTVVQIASSNPEFSLLVKAVTKAGLASTLSGAGPFTVFAPTNAAFEAAGLNSTAIDNATVETLTKVLTYHVIATRVFSSDLANGTVQTVQGSNVTIAITTNAATVKGMMNSSASNITATDLIATNGVVHVIDQVLMP
jgi:uncharacterized surface protein with fasciclin (FAS1) repeats